MNRYTFILLLTCLLTGPLNHLQAQKMLAEGQITYLIHLIAPNNTTPTQSGHFTITIKNNRVLQELAITGGYKSVSISRYKSGKYIILQTVNKIHYAIEMDLQTVLDGNHDKRDARLLPGGQTRQLHQYTIHAASLEYTNGQRFPFFYVKDYLLEHPEIFAAMPELKGIPAIFELPMNNGYLTRFELQTIEEIPVDNEVFQVPESYRIISEKEYQQLIK